jgi:prevent-host-death family protein
MDIRVTATEANQRFSEILRRAQQGESFVVTSRGRPVVRMEAVSLEKDQTREERAESFRALVKSLRQHPITVLDWKREGLYD